MDATQKSIASPSRHHQHQVTYTASAVPGNASSSNDGSSFVRRIRTPSSTDVLSGRGGSVNQHPGNIQFRLWVNERKHDYNLAKSKVEKAVICREVIARVTTESHPPGRFLARDETNSSFWIELDEERIMAKTSQALREGAPKIREEVFERKVTLANPQEKQNQQRSSTRRQQSQHQTEPSARSVSTTISKNNIPYQPPLSMPSFRIRGSSSNPVVVKVLNTGGTMTEGTNGRPLTRKAVNQQSTLYGSSVSSVGNSLTAATKRVRLTYNGKEVRPNDLSPPLAPKTEVDILESFSLPPPISDDQKMLYRDKLKGARDNEDDGATPTLAALPVMPPVGAFSEKFSRAGLKRCHSLALSESDSAADLGGYDFVNPFDNEEDVFLFENGPASKIGGDVLPAPRIGVLREHSTSSNGDLGGLKALLRGSGTSAGKERTTMSSSLTSYNVECIEESISSRTTLNKTSSSISSSSDSGNVNADTVLEFRSALDKVKAPYDLDSNTVIQTVPSRNASNDTANAASADWRVSNERSTSFTAMEQWWNENGGAYADLDDDIPVPMPVSP